MARNIRKQLVLKGTLVATTPVHVGGFGDDVDTDLPLARNGQGQWYVPGTSLAGTLRQWCCRLMGERAASEIWGFQKGQQGHASFVVVDDAVVENAGQTRVEVRDHVGIDRQWGRAADGIKFDRGILSRGTRLSFRLTVHVAGPVDHPIPEWLNGIQVTCPQIPTLHSDGPLTAALAVVHCLKQAMENGQIRVGAAKTRGLGKIKLENAKVLLQDWSTADGILKTVGHGARERVDRDAGEEISPTFCVAHAARSGRFQPHSSLTITVTWHPVGPTMVKSGYDGVAADMLPLVSNIDGKVALVLPGSSIKGALRAHAERIVRTVCAIHEPAWSTCNEDDRLRFLDAVDVALVNDLFGRRGEKQKHTGGEEEWQPEEAGARQMHCEDENCLTCLPGLAALAIDDCFGCDHWNIERWQAIEAAQDDASLREALRQAGLNHWSEAYHVAIDRWLGSAAESMLFTVLEPHNSRWEPIRITVDLDRLPESRRLAAIALLLFVLRDLVNDRIPLGFATHRGMGSICVTKVEIGAQGVEEPLAQLDGKTLSRPQQEGRWPLWNHIPEHVRQELNKAWQNWLRESITEGTS